jgi:hypothetical protein
MERSSGGCTVVVLSVTDAGDELQQPGHADVRGAAIIGVRPGRPNLGSAGYAALEGSGCCMFLVGPGGDGWLCCNNGYSVAHMSLPSRPLPTSVWRLLNLLHHRWAADGGVGTCSSASKNKEAVLGSLSCHDKDLMIIIIDLAGVSSSKMFHRQTPMDDLPGDCRIGWDFVMRNHVFF